MARFYPKYLETAFDKGFERKEEDAHYHCHTKAIGSINITGGQVIACDPLLFSTDEPFEQRFPNGQYPVEVCIAEFEEDERIAFARVKFSDAKPVNWEIATTEGQDARTLGDNDIFGYPVDSATGCFMDANGRLEYLAKLEEHEDHHEQTLEELEKNYQDTRSWYWWSHNKGNIVMFSTGDGDGVFPSYIGYDSNNNICRLVTDFSMFEWED